jgi:protein-tyrosine phosphatase
MTKILMVCLGNICRSPLAEGILQNKLPDDEFWVDSAGTSSYHVGNLPDSRSVDIASKNNIDISKQRSRQFTISDFDKFDYIYAMDQSNYKNILKLARNLSDKNKVSLILNELYPKKNIEVPDPYYGKNDGFNTVFSLLNDACTKIASNLINEQ